MQQPMPPVVPRRGKHCRGRRGRRGCPRGCGGRSACDHGPAHEVVDADALGRRRGRTAAAVERRLHLRHAGVHVLRRTSGQRRLHGRSPARWRVSSGTWCSLRQRCTSSAYCSPAVCAILADGIASVSRDPGTAWRRGSRWGCRRAASSSPPWGCRAPCGRGGRVARSLRRDRGGERDGRPWCGCRDGGGGGAWSDSLAGGGVVVSMTAHS
jgi:hypothetical protein